VGAAPDRLGARARVAVTNVTFREQWAATVHTDVVYTNKLLTFIAPRVSRGTQHLSADGLLADFNSEFVYLTNGYGNADPLFVARAINKKVGETIEPYQFKNPPTARVRGTIPMHGEEGADLHFDLEGGPFHWWKFNLPWIAGHLHWAGLRLQLSEMRCQFYDGTASGAAGFAFPKGAEMEFHFTGVVTNALLQLLMADLSDRTNHLEGRLDGTLVVNQAFGSRTDSVQGYGDMRLRDGLVWTSRSLAFSPPFSTGSRRAWAPAVPTPPPALSTSPTVWSERTTLKFARRPCGFNTAARWTWSRA